MPTVSLLIGVPVQLKKTMWSSGATTTSSPTLHQEALAEQIGVSIKSISNMERGIHGSRFPKQGKTTRVRNVHRKSLFDFEEE